MAKDDMKDIDIDELAQKIENRIKELEKKSNEEETKIEETVDDGMTDEHILELDEIINEIDQRIAELERSENAKIDIDDLQEKVNTKLEKLEHEEDDIDRTINDLSQISDSINEMMKTLEVKRKMRKKKKAMYCDLARKKARGLRIMKSKSSS